MKLRSISYLLLTLVLLACGKAPEGGETKIPANIMSEQEFAKVLADFALAESAANLNVKNVAIQKLDTVYAFDPLKDNRITKAKYDSTLQFYASHPDLYKKVYETVLASLSELQTSRDSIATGPKKDSAATVLKKNPTAKKDSTAK